METPESEPRGYTQDEWEKKAAEISARHRTGTIRVRRSSGKVEEGWVFSGINFTKGRLIVSAMRHAGGPGESGKFERVQKELTIEEFEELNN